MNDNSFVKGFAYTVGAILFLAFMALMVLYGAWAGAFVSVHLWMWFVVPTFGLAPLKMSAALALLVRMWTYHHSTGHKDERSWQEKLLEIAGEFLSPWFVLLVGYVCHHYFM